jgi:hypothetical protein
MANTYEYFVHLAHFSTFWCTDKNLATLPNSRNSGTDIMILKIFAPKKSAKKLAF